MAVIQQNITKSGLDEIFDSAYEMDKQPSEVRADDSLFFRQGETQWLTHQYSEFMGPGKFNKVVVDEEVPEATIREGNKVSAEVFEYDLDVPIPERYQEAAEAYDLVQRSVYELGVNAMTSRDQWAFEQSYGDAFGGVDTPDGIDLVSNSHVSLNGDTIDNLETGALSADNLFTVIKSLRLQKAQNGRLASYHADGVLVPVNLAMTAHEVAKSQLKAGTGNNNDNYFSTIYPGLQIGVSEWLDSTYNTLNSNANTSYFAVSRRHSICRKVRVPLTREYVSPEISRKRTAYYRARFSERVVAGSWGGVVGSNGTV